MSRWFLLASALLATLGGASAFVTPVRSAAMPARAPRTTRGVVRMGKMAKFGIFSPAVLGAKKLLGEKSLNKIRGQAISLHSQVITEFCVYVGCSSKTRGGLIKKAKTTGDELGFLY